VTFSDFTVRWRFYGIRLPSIRILEFSERCSARNHSYHSLPAVNLKWKDYALWEHIWRLHMAVIINGHIKRTKGIVCIP